jgi:hypothetical protein
MPPAITATPRSSRAVSKAISTATPTPTASCARASSPTRSRSWVPSRRPGRNPGLERLPARGDVLRASAAWARWSTRSTRGCIRSRSPGSSITPATSTVAFDITFLPIIEAIAAQCPSVRGWIAMIDADRHAGVRQDPEPDQLRGPCWRRARRLARGPSSTSAAVALCYTSGTTGNPKGAMYSHRSTVLHAYAALPDAMGASAPRFDPAGRADVPRQRLGAAVCVPDGRGQAGASPGRRWTASRCMSCSRPRA